MTIMRWPFVALSVLGLGCTEPPPLTSAPAELLILEGTELWTARGNVIPLCWLNPGHDAEKALIKAAVARTWAAVAPITVVWREGCPFTGTESWVRVSVREAPGTDSSGSVEAGTAAAAAPTAPVWCANAYGIFIPCPGLELSIGSDRAAAEHVVIHEFGHILGFEHEQNREEPEARACVYGAESVPGIGVGPYDPDSVMNYCGGHRSRLSEGDIANVREVYGYRPDRADRLADLDGDGMSDVVATNLDGNYAMSSNGFGFADWRHLSMPFYGDRETAYGDLDGDGADDAIAINFGAIYAMRSYGWTLGDFALWTTFPYYGNRRTLVGDVDGDQRADVVAVNLENVWVMRSDGTQLTSIAYWGGPSLHGTVQTDLADVDGDHRADLIANRGALGVFVARSTGAGFLPAERWTAAGVYHAHDDRKLFVADRELGFGDVDGDGDADALAVRYDGIYVRRSNGIQFLTEERWTTAPVVGDRATLFGDVTGDGLVDVVAVNHDADHVLVSTGTGFVPFGAPWTAHPFYSWP